MLHTILLRVFSLIFLAVFWQVPCPASEPAACNPDAFNNVAEVKQCFDQYEELFSRAPQGRFEVLVRLARLSFMLGELSNHGEQKKFFEKGKSYAELLAQEKPTRVEGHYWLALNLCGLAENSSAAVGYRLLPTILQEMEQAAKIDPSYDQAGPHRVLGRIFFEAPGWPISVGDLGKSIRHLEEAVKRAPQNSTNNLFLGEAYGKSGDRQRAREQLGRVFQATQHALLPDNIKNDRRKAGSLLAQYRDQES